MSYNGDMSQQELPPFISQYASLPPEWASRGCGLVALKIVLDYWHGEDERNQSIPLFELLERGLASGAYLKGIGWRHAGLAHIATELGYEAFNRDLPKEQEEITAEKAMEVLKADVEKGPVLVSIWKNFDPQQKGGHFVVIHDISDGVVRLVDPEKENEAEGRMDIPKALFIRGFKLRSICLIPK